MQKRNILIERMHADREQRREVMRTRSVGHRLMAVAGPLLRGRELADEIMRLTGQSVPIHILRDEIERETVPVIRIAQGWAVFAADVGLLVEILGLELLPGVEAYQSAAQELQAA